MPILGATFGAIYAYRLSLKGEKEDEIYLTTKEISTKLGITLNQTYKLLRSGELQGAKIGRNWVIREEWMENYLDKQESNEA